MKPSTKLFTVLSLLVLTTLVFVPAALAFDGRSGDRIVIGKDEVINEDLYLGGTEIIVDGTINGDLMAAGQTITVNGKVTGDLYAAGNSVTVNGEVGDDLFAAAAAVTLGPEARISDDVFSAGYSVESQSGSQVGGTMLLGAFQGIVSANVAKDLLVGAERLRLEGTVGGDAKVEVNTSGNNYNPAPMWFGPNTPSMPNVPAGLTFGEGAVVGGMLEYTSVSAVNIPSSVTTQVQHQLPPADQQVATEVRARNTTTSAFLDNTRRLIALLVVGLLVAWLVPGWVLKPAGKLQSRPWPSLGIGFLGLVAIPIALMVGLALVVLAAILLGALTLGELVGAVLALGLPGLALVGALIFLALGYLPQAIVAYLGGRWILQRTRPTANEKPYWPMLLGLVILGILIALPVIGGLIEFFVVLFGLGAIALYVWGLRTPAQPAPVEA